MPNRFPLHGGSRWTAMVAAGALVAVGGGCSEGSAADRQEASVVGGEAPSASDPSRGGDASTCPSNAGPAPASATPSSPGPPPSATCSSTGRVTCTLPAGVNAPQLPTPDSGPFMLGGFGMIAGLSSVPVIARAGIGAPPAATGGAVAPGDYQLVAVTVYDKAPPNVVGPAAVGETIGAMLHVSCDTYNILYGIASPDSGLGSFSGNGCGRLVPFAIPLTAVAGLTVGGDTGGDSTPYSATPGMLTLIQLQPYDSGWGVVEGSSTIVEEFAAVGAPATASSVAPSPCTALPARASRDPRCPVAVPVADEPCTPDPAPLECEYGGDSLGRCTTLAICALQPDGTFHFVVPSSSPSGTCGSISPECPSTFASASAAQVGADAGLCAGGSALQCDYPEGQCGCGSDSSSSSWICAPRAKTADCPAQRPLSGDGCTRERAECYYGNPCQAGTYEGTPLVCSSGYWEEFNAVYSCPARSQ